ncbi:MAG: hypothetical protein VYA34_03765, partial [Myxococcota bacterium]|nr:hypothetical protein [Myxococcota bacterium]
MKSIFFLALLFFPALGLADDFDFGEDYEEEQESWSFPFRGTFSSGVGYQIGEPQGLPLLDLSTGLVLDWSGVWGQLAGEGDVKANFSHLLADRSQETIDTYTVVPIFREIYYSYAWAWGSLRAGKFMTVWSSGDLLPLVDVLTAQDLTQSFFAKPDQIRIGQVGMRFDFYFENHTINVLWHGWPQSSRFVDGDHPYSFLSVPCTDVGEPKTSSWPDCKREGAVMAGLQLPIGEIWDPTEFALRWNYKGQALSFSVQGGRVFSRNPSIGFEVSGVSEIEGAPPVLSARFSPYYFGAITYTHVLGALLFKAEVMGTLDEPTPIFSGQVPETVPKDGIKAMVGLDYTHEDWGSFLVEC